MTRLKDVTNEGVDNEPATEAIVTVDGSTVIEGEPFDPDFTDSEHTEEVEPLTPGGEMSKEDRDKAIREVYAIAQAELRSLHQDEFNTLRKDLLAERGIDWSPPLSKLDKARAEMKRLLAENPELAE